MCTLENGICEMRLIWSMLSSRPLGFDLEWRIFFRKGMSPSERRTALIQLCDTRTILLVHVSAMKSMLLLGLNFGSLVLPTLCLQDFRRKSRSAFGSEYMIILLTFITQEILESSKVVKIGANILSESIVSMAILHH